MRKDLAEMRAKPELFMDTEAGNLEYLMEDAIAEREQVRPPGIKLLRARETFEKRCQNRGTR